MSESNTLYLGDKEIIHFESGAEPGTKRLQVKYEKPILGGEGKMEEVIESFDIPEWEFEVAVTNYKEDERYVKERCGGYVREKVWDVVKALNVRVDELGHYLQMVLEYGLAVESRAISNAFGVSERRDIRLNSHWEANKGDAPIQY